MLDEDDVEAIALEHALADLLRESRKLADPEMGLQSFLDLVVAVLLHQQAPGRPLSWVLVVCARRTMLDIRCSL